MENCEAEPAMPSWEFISAQAQYAASSATAASMKMARMASFSAGGFSTRGMSRTSRGTTAVTESH